MIRPALALAAGAERPRERAAPLMERVRDAAGLHARRAGAPGAGGTGTGTRGAGPPGAHAPNAGAPDDGGAVGLAGGGQGGAS
jgi:hypothetical protein